MFNEIPGEKTAEAVAQAHITDTIYTVLSFLSPFLLAIAASLIILSFAVENRKAPQAHSKAIGAYNPAFDPFAKQQKSDKGFLMQVFAIILFILGILPLIVNASIKQ